MLARRQLHLELLDKGGHIAVGDNRAFILLDAEYRLRHGNLQVLFHLHLASQTPMLLYLLAGEETHLGGQDGAAAFQHTAFALSAGAFSAACRGQVNLLLGQRRDKGVARGHSQFLVVVNRDCHIALRHQFVSQHQKQCHQQQDDDQSSNQ